MNKSYVNSGRLVRDLDKAIISGICAGAAKQVGVDPLWVRVAAIIGVIVAPLVFLPGYALGVVLVPKA